jgi:hypothetical protein
MLPAFYRFRHNISDAGIGGRSCYCKRGARPVGTASVKAFTVADLAAAAMLTPLLQPPEIQYLVRVELPPYRHN